MVDFRYSVYLRDGIELELCDVELQGINRARIQYDIVDEDERLICRINRDDLLYVIDEGYLRERVADNRVASVGLTGTVDDYALVAMDVEIKGVAPFTICCMYWSSKCKVVEGVYDYVFFNEEDNIILRIPAEKVVSVTKAG